MTSTEFSDRSVIITGGASGIGLRAGKLFQDLGARNVILIDRDWTDSEANGEFNKLQTDFGDVEQIETSEGRRIRRMVHLEADVGNVDHIEALFDGGQDSIQRRVDSRVDVLVNAAGENLACDIVDVSPEQWDRVFASNLKSLFMLSRKVIPLMKENGGAIVNVSSTASLLPRTNDPVYGVSKSAMNDLTRRLALRRAENRIRVNAVCPGAVSGTRIQRDNGNNAADKEELRQQLISQMPLGEAFGRMIEPNEVAQLIVYLASDIAQMITGAVIPVDGGKSLGIPPHLNTNRVG